MSKRIKKRIGKIAVGAVLFFSLNVVFVGCEHNILTMKYKEDVKVEQELSEKVEQSKKDAIHGKEIVEVYIITPSYVNPFFKAESEALARKLKEYGYQVRATSHVDETKDQETLFQEAVDNEAAAIICDNADSKLSESAIKEAREQGIVTVLVDRGIKDEGIAFSQVLSNNKQGASLVAEQFAKEMQQKGKYIELLGLESDENAAIRSEAFHDYLDKIKEMEMVARERADWDAVKAEEVVEQLLQKHPDVKGILCGNDTMALGALEAVKAAKLERDVIITGIDGSDDVIDEIKKGNIKATALQPVDEIAAVAVEELHNYLTKKQEPKNEVQHIPCVLVTKENADLIEGFSYHKADASEN